MAGLSTWPRSNPLPIRAEMRIGGAWVDITTRIRLANEIWIQNRGRQSEQGRPGVSTCNFTLNNRDGFFSGRAMTSVNYGKIPKNAQFRVGIIEDTQFLYLDPAESSRCYTIDKAQLDITGDMDIRAEIEPEKWSGRINSQIIAAKFKRTGDQRSWFFALTSRGYPQIIYNATGGPNTSVSVTSTAPLPTALMTGRVALRVQVDVDNGSGNSAFTFAYASSINGTYTTLGSTVLSGVFSFYSSSADLEIGAIDDGGSGIGGTQPFTGRCYGFQLRSGINGTLVANMDPTTATRGTDSFNDGLTPVPNFWFVLGDGVEITPDDRRFYGEMASLPQRWDTSGIDVYVPAQAADVTRRLGQGNATTKSSWKQYWTGVIGANSPSQVVTGYWPFEDGSTSTQGANLVPRGAPATADGATFQSAGTLNSSAGCVQIVDTTTRIYGNCLRRGTTQYCFANFMFKMSSIPPASVTLIDFACFGDIGRINISVTNTAYVLALYDPDGFLIASKTTGFGVPSPDDWVAMRLQLSQSGATGQVDLGWYRPSDKVLYGAAATTFTGTAGNIVGFTIKGIANNLGTQFCHLATGNYFLNNATADYTKTASAFDGESTTARWLRVCAQNGINGQILGNYERKLTKMGPQAIARPLDVLYEVADMEQGEIYPSRYNNGLILRTWGNLYNQVGPSVSYTGNELGASVPEPTDDDQFMRNFVTASRRSGSSATSIQDSGVNNINSPFATTDPGIGVYDVTVQREAYLDATLANMAGWERFLGTWDEMRWPGVRIDLERAPFTGSAAALLKARYLRKLDIGDVWSITNLVQAGIPGDDAVLLIQGMTEVIGNRKHWLTFNNSPAGPFFGNDLTNQRASRQRAAASNSVTAAGFNASTLSFTVTTATGKLWGTTAKKPGNFPLNVMIAGELITISGITGTGTTQTFTASARGVNNGGVGKTHLSSEPVQVQFPFYAQLRED